MIKLNENVLAFGQFPNGETNVKGIQEAMRFYPNQQTITFKYESDSDLIHLMFVKKYLDSINRSMIVNLTITYMPYSRMDRVEGASVFTLKYIAEFINSLNFSSVVIVEPHSDVTPALIDNCITTFPSIHIFYDILTKTCFDRETDYVYFADAGSEKRYGKMLVGNFNKLVGFKDRDFTTGKIKSLNVFGNIKKKGFKAIIIDDLSSYGGTFMLGAEKLRELGASEIYLVIGHAENSIYKGDIFKSDLIDKVFTTDSIIDKAENDKIEIYTLNSCGVVYNG